LRSSHECASSSIGGCTARAMIARIIEPPMTTIASGFCVCEPMPFETAAGNRPIIATSVVIRHGRRRFSAASRAASTIDKPSTSRRRWKYVTTKIASCTAMPKMEMKPIAADTEKCVPVTKQREDASRARHRDVREHDDRIGPVLHRAVNEERDQEQRDRQDQLQAVGRPPQLDLAAHSSASRTRGAPLADLRMAGSAMARAR